MDMLKGISEKSIEIISDLGNNFIEIKNYLDVGSVDSSVPNFFKEGLFEACKKANIEFKKKKKLNLGKNINYSIKILPKEDIFILCCKEVWNSSDINKVIITMNGITYDNFITAYEVITKKYIVNLLNEKIDNILNDNNNVINKNNK